MSLTCVVIDDSEEFLAAASRLLATQGMVVAGCAGSRSEALELTAATSPDVALVDVDLGDEDGVELATELAAGAVPTPVILISAYDQEDLPQLLDGSGALGFLPKTALGAEAIARLLR